MINLKDKFELFDNKIVILYILDNSSMPLTTDQIAKFCEELEDITYFVHLKKHMLYIKTK